MGASTAFHSSLGGGSILAGLSLRPSGRGPTSGAFFPLGQFIVTLTRAGGGSHLGGGCPYSSRMLRQVHLLLVRGRLACLLPSWGRHLLLGGRWSCLSEARSSWCPGPCCCGPSTPTTSADTGSGQQVFRSEGREHVHWCLVAWRQPWCWVSQWRHPAD